jgi:hypothetical protein
MTSAPFELGDIAHARALFVPETLKGMTWDDALICSMLGGVPIRVERKHRDSRPVRVFMSITITGNHLPHFITSSEPNKSGIDRRLLLLKVDKLLQGKIDDHYARKLVAEEGPAILMWFVQHAIEGYQSLQTNGSFYGDTVNKAKAAAEAYKAKMSPHLQWMEEEDVVLEPGARTNAHQTWRGSGLLAQPRDPALATVIDARPRDIGGFAVGRVLPATACRHVGPFVFFDHMGPAALAPGRGVDVRPHPHIGLATVTYLFEGGTVPDAERSFVMTAAESRQPVGPRALRWRPPARARHWWGA